MESLDSPVNRYNMVKLPILLLHTKLFHLKVGCKCMCYTLLMWHCQLEKTAEHHTTYLAFPDVANNHTEEYMIKEQ